MDDKCFTFKHAKTTPIKDPDESLIYSLSYSERPNVKRKLISTASDIEAKVTRFFVTDKVFYQSNEIGEIVRNYIMTSMKNNVLSVK